MCHDERFLNLWIVDRPFKLDTLKEVPRIVSQGMFLSSVDDKSGYDHVRLSEDSRSYFGIQYGGWFFVYNTIPFGWKLSAYVYQQIGLVATSYCRSLNVPCLQYIDDRLVGELGCTGERSPSLTLAKKGLFIVCEVLLRLGYFLALKKCVFYPCQILKFLGMIIDSIRLAFIIPVEKRKSFALLREHVTERDKILQ